MVSTPEHDKLAKVGENATAKTQGPKRQLIRLDGSPAPCKCCVTTETPYACMTCRQPLCTVCAEQDGCPGCDTSDEGFAPECSQ